MKSLFLLLVASLMSFLMASSTLGVYEKVDGNVKVKKEGSFKKLSVNNGDVIAEGDLITTAKDSSAVLKLEDGSSLVLDASSSVHFPSQASVEQSGGKIFYKITSRAASNALKVKTPFAIIGIKGTTFIVNADENASSVKLKEGLVGIASLKEEFELYRKQVEKEFQEYMNEQAQGFEEYKKAATEGVAEMTKAFDLQAGNTISFDGQKVNEQGWSKEDDAEFDRFEAMMQAVVSQKEE